MEKILTLIYVTAFAGIGGTGLGGVIGALFKKDSDRTASLLLSFAAGVMVAIVCFDFQFYKRPAIQRLIVTAMIVCAGIAFGVLVVYSLNFFIDRFTNLEVEHIDNSHPQTADDLDEIIHSNHLSVHIKKHDTKMATVLCLLAKEPSNLKVMVCIGKNTETKW